MKIRHHGSLEKIRLDTTPLINVVFLLVIFYMCTLKVSGPEGDFSFSMPLEAPSASAVTAAELPPYKVRLVAGDNGELISVLFNGSDLGNGQEAFAKLNSEVFRAITALNEIGPGQQEEQEVEIDSDYNLHYHYVIKAIGSCSGGLGQNGLPIRYISQINFAPRREP